MPRTSCTRARQRASSPPSSAPPTCSWRAAAPDGVQVGASVDGAPARPPAAARARGGGGGAPRGDGGRPGARRAWLRLPGRAASSRKSCSPARWSGCACASRTARRGPLLCVRRRGRSTALQVTRTQHEQRGFAVRPGQPSPSACAACTCCRRRCRASPPAPRAQRSPRRWSAAAAGRARGAHADARRDARRAAARGGGCAVRERRRRRRHTVLAAQPDCALRAEWLLRRGAQDLLVLPQEARATAARAHPLGRMRRAQRDARGLGEPAAPRGGRGGVRRHLARTAPTARGPQGMRELLDARSEAQAAHGLEMRTELHFGDVAAGARAPPRRHARADADRRGVADLAASPSASARCSTPAAGRC